MIFEVELQAFGGGTIRRVEVPDHEVPPADKVNQTLETVFIYGQNDVQRLEQPSVSVGDVIRLYGKRYVVAPLGFRELAEGEEPAGGPGGILEYLR